MNEWIKKNLSSLFVVPVDQLPKGNDKKRKWKYGHSISIFGSDISIYSTENKKGGI